MTLLTVLAIWLALSLVVGLSVVALCRGGRAEDDQRAVMNRALRPRRRGRRPRTLT